LIYVVRDFLIRRLQFTPCAMREQSCASTRVRIICFGAFMPGSCAREQILCGLSTIRGPKNLIGDQYYGCVDSRGLCRLECHWSYPGRGETCQPVLRSAGQVLLTGLRGSVGKSSTRLAVRRPQMGRQTANSSHLILEATTRRALSGRLPDEMSGTALGEPVAKPAKCGRFFVFCTKAVGGVDTSEQNPIRWSEVWQPKHAS
jgi:hypothetical protein